MFQVPLTPFQIKQEILPLLKERQAKILSQSILFTYKTLKLNQKEVEGEVSFGLTSNPKVEHLEKKRFTLLNSRVNDDFSVIDEEEKEDLSQF